MLKKLELAGFKSFAEKTTLSFAEGITAIVGPNGVGKSNFIDCLRWLLGEREAKNLRGGRVEDLIFAGTPKKPRVGLAQASIYFDNSSQVFPVEFSEVVVSREVDRGGNSRYYLNQVEVRLKDLVDFFARARLGVKGLAIIGQGESDMFLRAAPLERRQMMEEILGLREYQLKKAEAERKLKHTTVNLEKTEALAKEILPHLRVLKRQTSRWERREDLANELKNLELIFYGTRFAEIKAVLKSLTPERERIASIIAEEEHKLLKLQQEADMAEGTSGGYHQELKKLQEERASCDAHKSKLEKEIGRLEAQIEFFQERAEEISEDIDVNRAIPFLRRLKSKLEILSSILDLDAVRREVRGILEEMKDVFRARKPRGMTLSEVEARHKNISLELSSISSKSDELRVKERETASRIESESSAFKEALTRIQKKKDEIKELERGQNKILFEEERARLQFQDLEYHIQAASIGIKDIENRTIALPADFNPTVYERNIMRLRGELASMGEIDEALVKETHETEERYAFLTSQAADLKKALKDLACLQEELGLKIDTEFAAALKSINTELTGYFELMFGGGRASLKIQKPDLKTYNKEEEVDEEDEKNGAVEEEKPAELGIDIEVSLPRKRITGLQMLSGGERSLVSIAVLFALAAVSPPPFLVLDEIDAALDEKNTKRFADMLRGLSKKTQFVLVTHNRATMEAANVLYGVTMGEDGTSKMLSLKLD